MNTVKKIICKVLIFLFIGTIIIISVGPLLWVLFSSFKTNKEILSGSLGLPAAFNFDNYADALKIAPIPQFYLNSIIVAVAATVLNVFLHRPLSMEGQDLFPAFVFCGAVDSGRRAAAAFVPDDDRHGAL